MTDDAKNEFTGGCACGAVRYVCTGPKGFSFHCQCRSCQRISGTGHSSIFICKEEDTNLTGRLSWYERTTPSGGTVRNGFCPTCGSPILNRNSGYPENLFVTAGSLDAPASFEPTTIVHGDEGHIWDFVKPAD